MSLLIKKNYIKMPEGFEVYCDCLKGKIFLKNSTDKCVINTKVRVVLLIEPSSRQPYLYVTTSSLSIKRNSVKTQKKLQRSTLVCIKNAFSSMSGKVCVKLKLVGIGYKAFIINQSENILLRLKLGYSHSIYLKIPSDITIKIIKDNKLFVFGTSIEKVTAMSAFIRSHKIPEPYKGKGILYVNETIQLKVGKKV